MDLRMGLWRIGGVGADIGQRLGINWLTYNVGVFHYYHTIASKMAPAYAKAVRTLWPEVRTAIDVGCGTGDYVAALSAVGISTTGYQVLCHRPHVCPAREWPQDPTT